MDLLTFEKLLSNEGQQLLQELRDSDLNDANVLKYITNYRKSYDSDIVGAAIDTALLRKRARAKYTRADEMYFTKEALEQASSEEVSNYRAERYRSFARVADLACSIGSDAIGLAKYCRVLAVDKDPLRIAMARKNAEVYGVADKIEFREADITELGIPAVDAIFFDPSRRSEGGRRVPSVKDYSPPLSIIDEWLQNVPTVGVKISPALKYEEITWDCEIEFISLDRELKDAVLWFGPLKTAERRATLLPSRATLAGNDSNIHVPITEPLAYLYEPDPAIIRSHLVETLAQDIGAQRIDQDIAYLTAEELIETPFARGYTVEEMLPFNIKNLNKRLRSLDVGRVVVKKRGSPIEPHELQKKLKLSGTREIVVVLTHIKGQPSIILCNS